MLSTDFWTDFWTAYAEVLPEELPEEQHRATGEGQTCKAKARPVKAKARRVMWSASTTSCASGGGGLKKLVRRTLSFSKNDVMHEE